MQNTELENCQTCFRPKSEVDSLSKTQWTSTCRCDRPYAPGSNFSINVCTKCKRRVAVNAIGKIERADLCSCVNPDSKNIPTFLKSNENDPLELNLSSIGMSPANFPEQRYKPVGFLGDGPGATVILARDKQRGTRVAVKCFKNIAPSMFPTFESEAKKNQQLSYASIAKIIDVGIHDGRSPYLVTEYKDGFNLEQCVALYGTPGYDVLVQILIGVGEALGYSSKQGLMHRDIKPGNIIFLDDLNSEPSISLTDFSMPKVKLGQPMTESVDALYMSCEEARGLGYSEKSEVYSLGCVAFMLLTGRPPFQDGSALELKNMHALKLPPRISSLKFDARRSTELEEIIERCLEKDPGSRFESVSKLIERLEVFPKREKLYISSVLATRKRKKMLQTGAVILALFVLLIVVYFILRHH